MQKIRYVLRQFGFFVLIYKFLKKFIKRSRFRYREKVKGEQITKKDLIKALPETGLKKGDKVIIHSSMSSVGVLEEGPKTIVEALMEYIGPEGLIVMPSFPHTDMHKYLTGNIIFDVRKSPSKNGAITEYFRKHEDTYRSLHPTHPIVAWGKGAEEIVKGHEHAIQPFDAKSPYKKLLDMNIKVMMLGVDLEHMTMMRLLDDLYEEYEVDYYMPGKFFEVDVIDHDGSTKRVKTRCHDPEYGAERYNMKIYPYLKDKIIHGKLYNADTMLMESRDIFKVQVESAEKGIYFFHKVPFKNRKTTTETEKS